MTYTYPPLPMPAPMPAPLQRLASREPVWEPLQSSPPSPLRSELDSALAS